MPYSSWKVVGESDGSFFAVEETFIAFPQSYKTRLTKWTASGAVDSSFGDNGSVPIASRNPNGLLANDLSIAGVGNWLLVHVKADIDVFQWISTTAQYGPRVQPNERITCRELTATLTSAICASSRPIGDPTPQRAEVRLLGGPSVLPQLPLGPITIGAGDITSTTATIGWYDAGINSRGFLVYRLANGLSTLVAGCPTLDRRSFQCTDTGLTPDTYYQYFVYGWNDYGSTIAETSVTIHTLSAAPVAPIATAAVSVGAHSVRVDWIDKSTDENGFRVYRYLNNGTYLLEATTAANATNATITDNTLDTTSAAIFVVRSFNGAGETNDPGYIYSASRSTPIVGGGRPAAPGYKPTLVTSTGVTINWADTATNESGYLVYRNDGTGSQLVPNCSISTPNLTTCTDNGLTPGTYYQYYVYAWNSSGASYAGSPTIVKTANPLLAPKIQYVISPTRAPGNIIELVWSNNATDTTSFEVWEFTSGVYSQVGTGTSNPYGTTLFQFQANVGTHIYLVVNRRNGEASYSAPIWATVPG